MSSIISSLKSATLEAIKRPHYSPYSDPSALGEHFFFILFTYPLVYQVLEEAAFNILKRTPITTTCKRRFKLSFDIIAHHGFQYGK